MRGPSPVGQGACAVPPSGSDAARYLVLCTARPRCPRLGQCSCTSAGGAGTRSPAVCSMRSVLAPLRAAATAAPMPAGPPPATATSQLRAGGVTWLKVLGLHDRVASRHVRGGHMGVECQRHDTAALWARQGRQARLVLRRQRQSRNIGLSTSGLHRAMSPQKETAICQYACPARPRGFW